MCGVCGSVGRAVVSNIRDLQFKSSHGQNLMMNIFTVNCGKDENKEKMTVNGPFLKTFLTNKFSFSFVDNDKGFVSLSMQQGSSLRKKREICLSIFGFKQFRRYCCFSVKHNTHILVLYMLHAVWTDDEVIFNLWSFTAKKLPCCNVFQRRFKVFAKI